jgi:threonylcarbamoyladenosine tRNA methylthiotransferase MtaB
LHGKPLTEPAVCPSSLPLQETADPRVVTFGCRLNTFESEVMRQLAREAGLGGDTVIVNTCSVTGEAERQARQAIRRLKREKPDTRIIVTGCSAQMNPDMYAAMPQVSHVLGNREKTEKSVYDQIARHVQQHEACRGTPPPARVHVSPVHDLHNTAAHLVSGFDGRARAFVEIQNGCDHQCTFCIITLARGPNRSVPVAQVVDQVRHLVERGYREVVFTGVDITGYGQDLPGKPSLGQMVRRVLRLVPGLLRLRLSSLDPVEVDEDLIRVWAEDSRLMPHAHLSLQSGSDMILKRMKRRHQSCHVDDLCARLKNARPDMVFGADVIAGFPTETDAMFQDTVDMIRRCPVAHLHVFPFSPRPGTPAARMPRVPQAIIRERARILREEGEIQLQHFLNRYHQTDSLVLVENTLQGRTAHYGLVKFETPADPAWAGHLVRCTLTGLGSGHWTGIPLVETAA